MTIRFPRMHIADSVLNRIYNAMDGDNPLAIPKEPPAVVPDPAMQGAVLDQQLMTPLPEAGVIEPEAADDAMTVSSAQGGSPFDGLLGSGSF